MPPDVTHPLMPGVRCAELWNPDWPRTLHDKQITGFSPLTCGMKAAPRVWATLDVGGEANWIEPVRGSDGEEFLLVNDGRLRLVALDGQVRWTSTEGGSLVFFGDLRGNGRDCVLLGGGPDLTVLDAVTGQTEWTYRFEPPHVRVRPAVADLLPDRPGMEVAVFLAYGEEGCLIHFPPEGEPEIVWRRMVVEPGEWPERADHGCDIQVDLSLPDEPIIWNVRHHRCRGFDARTGERVSSLVYEIGGGHRRNYGPWSLGWGRDGRPLICVVSEQIQTHVHAIRLRRGEPNELAWEHYYGEVYVVPGVAVKRVAIEDIDGDGATEVVYNVRDPEQDFRSFVRVRHADTGEIKEELPDCWCVGTYAGLGAEGVGGLLVYPASEGTTPERGDLTVYRFERSGRLEVMASLEKASLWESATLPGEQGNDLLLRQIDGDPVLVRYALEAGSLRPISHTRAPALLTAPVRTILDAPDGERIFVVAGPRGTLEALTWDGECLWELPLVGGPAPTLSAADFNGDGRAELVATTPGHRVRVFSAARDNVLGEIADHEFLGPRSRSSPLLYDLERDGRLCLVAPGSTEDGRVAVRAYRGDGSLLWETILDVSTAENGMAVAWNAGEFLPGPRSGVAISVANARRTSEGTYLLDGQTGEVLWSKGLYYDGSAIRGYRPCGLPTAFDVDGDGIEEIGMDLYSYMAFLRGLDGEFTYIRHTRNIRAEGALYAALLYNSYCPVYRKPDDEEPYWFVPLGHGSFGLMNPDPTDGVWREEIGYDVPPRVGMVDVDGDGVIEVGYAVLNDPTFRCRNLWTGEIKWELQLPSPPNSPVMAADVDGDGKGEFLVGQYCIGTDAEGNGEIRWESPVPLGWAIIADFDGDGMGEIACAGQGRIYILKGQGG